MLTLVVSNYGRFGFLTAPFCPTSQITQRTRISAFVVAQFIAPRTLKEKRRYELRDYKQRGAMNCATTNEVSVCKRRYQLRDYKQRGAMNCATTNEVSVCKRRNELRDYKQRGAMNCATTNKEAL